MCLLATGRTDEKAGRKPGPSVRTTRRMMARLMSMLKARSRFEAGVLAAGAAGCELLLNTPCMR